MAKKKQTEPKQVPNAEIEADIAPESKPDREEQVRLAAYLKAQSRGFAPGMEVDDWVAAENEVDGKSMY